jgi:hypothetical protein
MYIDHIETDTFHLGILGRSGTRSIANFLTRYYHDYYWESFYAKYFYSENMNDYLSFVDDEILKDFVLNGPDTHHIFSRDTIENFNKPKVTKKIVVLRDPLQRAKSGSRVSFEPTFHGMPILSQIDFDSVDYIIDFNEINYYINLTNVDRNMNPTEENMIARMYAERNPETYGSQLKEWKLENYDYREEVSVYNKLMETKEKLPFDVWKQLVRSMSYCNIPSMRKNLQLL